MFICQFCSSEKKSKNSLTQHEVRCADNPNRPTTISKPKTEKWLQAMKDKKIRGSARNQYSKAKELGLPKPEITEETREKLSKATTHNNLIKYANPENRMLQSLTMKRAVKNNPDSYTKNNVCGRVKRIEYNGVMLKGSWEVITAKWLDSLDEKWETEVNPQVYIWNGGEHLYFPDFYLPNRNVYIEVKGYKTDRDEAKWSQFVGTLVIIDKRIIDKLSSITIEEAIEKYSQF